MLARTYSVGWLGWERMEGVRQGDRGRWNGWKEGRRTDEGMTHGVVEKRVGREGGSNEWMAGWGTNDAGKQNIHTPLVFLLIFQQWEYKRLVSR